MKKGISFERIVVAFIILLLFIILIKSIDPGYNDCFTNKFNHEKHWADLEENSKKSLPINITIFIDPSSRISNTNEFGDYYIIERDTMIIRTFITDFLIRTRGTDMNTLKTNGNHFQIITHPDNYVNSKLFENFSRSISTYSVSPNSLTIWNRIMAKSMSIEPEEYTLDSIASNLLSHPTNNLSKLYNELLIKGRDASGNYKGSDIYSFLQGSEIDNKNVIRNDSRNILVLLTDGWLDYIPTRTSSKSNFVTHISTDNELSGLKNKYGDSLNIKVSNTFINKNLEIYVFGLSKVGKVDENPLLKQIWDKWLNGIVGEDKFKVFNYQGGQGYSNDIFNILNPLTEKNSK